MVTVPRSRSPLGLVGLLGLLAGCEPTCKNTCEKLLACDEVETPRLSLDDCTDSCEEQQALYVRWDDTQLIDAFAAYKTCVEEEGCAAIAEGVCYDEDLYAF
jgi:hypothetical protein